MKQTSLFLIGIISFSITASAQNWVNGGNSLTADGTFGIKSNFSLLFQTNNTERGRITSNGLWGFGTAKPTAKVHINSTASKDPLNVQVSGTTKLLVHSDGGLAVGALAVATGKWFVCSRKHRYWHSHPAKHIACI